MKNLGSLSNLTMNPEVIRMQNESLSRQVQGLTPTRDSSMAKALYHVSCFITIIGRLQLHDSIYKYIVRAP